MGTIRYNKWTITSAWSAINTTPAKVIMVTLEIHENESAGENLHKSLVLGVITKYKVHRAVEEILRSLTEV